MTTTDNPTCLAEDHDYSIINIRLMSAHQTPVVTCERCGTVWHSYTAARPGDLVLIPGHEPPADQTLTAAHDIATKAGVHLVFIDADPVVEPGSAHHLQGGLLSAGSTHATNTTGTP